MPECRFNKTTHHQSLRSLQGLPDLCPQLGASDAYSFVRPGDFPSHLPAKRRLVFVGAPADVAVEVETPLAVASLGDSAHNRHAGGTDGGSAAGDRACRNVPRSDGFVASGHDSDGHAVALGAAGDVHCDDGGDQAFSASSSCGRLQTHQQAVLELGQGLTDPYPNPIIA